MLGSGGSCNSAERGESVVVEFATSAQNHSFTTMNQLGYNGRQIFNLFLCFICSLQPIKFRN